MWTNFEEQAIEVAKLGADAIGLFLLRSHQDISAEIKKNTKPWKSLSKCRVSVENCPIDLIIKNF